MNVIFMTREARLDLIFNYTELMAACKNCHLWSVETYCFTEVREEEPMPLPEVLKETS